MLIWGGDGGREFVGPFLSNPTDLRKKSVSKAVKSILRKRFLSLFKSGHLFSFS